MLSKTSVPVRSPTAQVQVAFPSRFWEPSGWVTKWSCSVKLPVISPVTTPAGKETVTNAFPPAMRKPDGTGGATKKNVPATGMGVDAATGWTAMTEAPAASTKVSNRVLNRIMGPSSLAGSGMWHEPELGQDFGLVEVFALRLDPPIAVDDREPAPPHVDMPVGCRQQLASRKREWPAVGSRRLVLHGDGIALLDNELERSVHIRKRAEHLRIERDHSLTSFERRHPWPREFSIVRVHVSNRVQVVRIDRRIESPYPIRYRFHCNSSCALLATSSGSGGTARIRETPTSYIYPRQA